MAIDSMAIDATEEAQVPETQTSESAVPVAVPQVLMMEVEVKRWHGAGEGRVFGWQTMPVREALRLQEDTFRCPECLGRVRLRAAAPEKGLSERAEHYSKNTGCSLGNCFGGEKQPHAKPVS